MKKIRFLYTHWYSETDVHLHLQLELEFVVFNTHVETCQETRKNASGK